MKHYITILLISFFFVRCADSMLDIQPSDQLSDYTVWDTPSTANLFLNDIYNSLNNGPIGGNWLQLPAQVSNDILDNYTDNSTYGPMGGTFSATLFDNGSYSPTNLLFTNTWRRMYENIRKCNLFIEKINTTDFDEDIKKNMIAQARFLRVYYYKILIDIYGGVPLITRVLDRSGDEEIEYPRSSYEECITFIQEECIAAAADLPLVVTGLDIGRATKGAALMLKGSAELYAERWQEAAETHKQIMELDVYDLFPDYVGLFYEDNENNEEVIFDVQYAPIVKPIRYNQYMGVPDIPSGGGWGNCDPTQELIDSYEFIDGKTKDEGSAMYDPANPYRHREKRFYASILYDGSTWRGKTLYTRLGIPNNVNEINLTGIGGNRGRTGYFMRKLQDSTFQSTPTNLIGTNSIVFRYAETLLNYAEAQNEFAGPDQSVYDAINKVRSRVEQPPLPTGLSKDQMRERIRRERRIELAFEGKWFYDIRRWRLAEGIFSRPMHGMKITEDNGVLKYEVVEVRKVLFDANKNYLLPIPQYAIDQNSKLIQNPGY